MLIDQAIVSVQTKHIAGQSTASKEDPWMTNPAPCSMDAVEEFISSSPPTMPTPNPMAAETASKLEQLRKDLSGHILKEIQQQVTEVLH